MGLGDVLDHFGFVGFVHFFVLCCVIVRKIHRDAEASLEFLVENSVLIGGHGPGIKADHEPIVVGFVELFGEAAGLIERGE